MGFLLRQAYRYIATIKCEDAGGGCCSCLPWTGAAGPSLLHSSSSCSVDDPEWVVVDTAALHSGSSCDQHQGLSEASVDDSAGSGTFRPGDADAAAVPLPVVVVVPDTGGTVKLDMNSLQREASPAAVDDVVTAVTVTMDAEASDHDVVNQPEAPPTALPEPSSTTLNDTAAECTHLHTLRSMLQLAVDNTQDPGRAAALLDWLEASPELLDSSCRQLSPEDMEQLLATAIARGREALVWLLCTKFDTNAMLTDSQNFSIGGGERVPPKMDSAAVAGLMQLALQAGHEDCVVALCQLRGAAELDVDSLACLLLGTLQHRKRACRGFSGCQPAPQDLGPSGPEALQCSAARQSQQQDAVQSLCELCRAEDMDWGCVGSLLRIAVQQKDEPAACCLCQLPAAVQQLSGDVMSRTELLRVAMKGGVCMPFFQQVMIALDE